jgi:oligopeptide/dipeptide ABC transporter ATP-binding protein
MAIPGSPPRLTEQTQGCRFGPRCALATEVCTRKEPPLIDGAACWHPQHGGVL